MIRASIKDDGAFWKFVLSILKYTFLVPFKRKGLLFIFSFCKTSFVALEEISYPVRVADPREISVTWLDMRRAMMLPVHSIWSKFVNLRLILLRTIMFSLL